MRFFFFASSSAFLLLNITQVVIGFSAPKELRSHFTVTRKPSSTSNTSSDLGLLSRKKKIGNIFGLKDNFKFEKYSINFITALTLSLNLISCECIAATIPQQEYALPSSTITVSVGESDFADFSLPSYEETARAATNTNLKGNKDLLGDNGAKFAAYEKTTSGKKSGDVKKDDVDIKAQKEAAKAAAKAAREKQKAAAEAALSKE